MKLNRKNIFKFFLAFLITLALVGYMAFHVNVSQFINLLKTFPLYWLIMAFILYVMLYISRALRFEVCFKRKIKIQKILPIVAIHNMANNILPMRVGEFSFIYLLRKQGLKGTRALGILATVRILDFIIMSILFFTAVLLIPNLPSFISTIFLTLAAFMVFLIILLISLIYYGKNFINFMRFWIDLFKLRKLNFINYILEKSKQVVFYFKEIKSKRKLFYLLLLSFTVWFFQYSTLYAILHGMNINLSIWQVIIVSTFISFSLILPIQGVAGFGTMEGLWSLALISQGIPSQLAVSSGFAQHIIIMGFYSILGIIGILAFKSKAKGI